MKVIDNRKQQKNLVAFGSLPLLQVLMVGDLGPYIKIGQVRDQIQMVYLKTNAPALLNDAGHLCEPINSHIVLEN